MNCTLCQTPHPKDNSAALAAGWVNLRDYQFCPACKIKTIADAFDAVKPKPTPAQIKVRPQPQPQNP